LRALGLVAVWIVCALAWLPRAHAEATLRIEDVLDGVELGTRLAIFEDTTGVLDFAHVSSASHAHEFVASQTASPSFGFKHSVFWLRFRAENRGETVRPWLLEVAYPQLDHVDLYSPDAGGGYRVRKEGDFLPFRERDLSYRTFIFSLQQAAHSEATYYVRVQTTGSVNLPLVAWTSMAFIDHQSRELSGFFLFYGILLVMATYNLFLFFFLRQKEYLYYVLYNFSLLLFQFTINGHTFQYLLPTQIWLANNLLPFVVGMNFLWTTLFMQVYLQLGTYFPRANRALSMANYAWVALSLLGLCGFYALSIRLLVVGTLLSTVCSPFIVIPLVRQGIRQARLYIVAWGALISGVIAYVLKTLGILQGNPLTEWGIQIGASVEVVLLSLALADRINSMRGNLSALNEQLSQNVSDLKLALEQAQAGTRAKLDFLATVSHELRTPLNAIINIPGGLLRDFRRIETACCAGCASVFELEAGDEVSAASTCPECSAIGTLAHEEVTQYHGQPEATARHLRHIEHSGKHLLQMVNGLLDFSKVEAGKLSLSMAEVCVAELLADTVEPLEALATRAGVTLSLGPVAPDLLIRADPLRIKQVLINLIGNAIKFSDGRGTVRVSAQGTGRECIFSVCDEGIGIAAEDCARVFQSFEQVHRGDTRKYGGTGLGLSICKALVEMHGGEIWVESALGVGSTFSFRIPGVARLATAQRPSTPPPPAQPPAPLLRDETSTPKLATGTMTAHAAALPRAGLKRESAS
jgi:signal transduction histidine kinase